jgi:Aspartate/ornithine carbamoyltransferase, carbamoyl-P binding domain
MSTMVELRGRHLMKLADYSPEEIAYLLDLAADLKAAKREGREEQKLVGKEIALIFEKDSTRVRSSRLRPGRTRHLHRPGRLPHGPQGDREGHGARPRAHV